LLKRSVVIEVFREIEVYLGRGDDVGWENAGCQGLVKRVCILDSLSEGVSEVPGGFGLGVLGAGFGAINAVLLLAIPSKPDHPIDPVT
jgi:hypothetical protein